MRGGEATEVLDLFLHHARRLLAVYRKENAATLAHGNRGRKSHHTLDASMKRQMLKLAQSTYVKL